MHRSSQSISSLAAALAKAQIDLVNPEKSLTATIRLAGPGRAEQTFSYASLSSGLDIVRKTLGQHEIATVQTTAMDQAAGIINLTTILVHASGEWIASDWPVCPISETATPHRMGAALTYARRYALFTLVGIAGEDDLDAPDLAGPANSNSKLESEGPYPDPIKRNGNRAHRLPAKISRQRPGTDPIEAALGAAGSAELRSQLLAELSHLKSDDDAALWAHRRMGQKNRLTAGDAQQVEEAFRARLISLQGLQNESGSQDGAHGADPSSAANPVLGTNNTTGIDKSVLVLSEPRRIRDREHVKSVMRHACLVCGRVPCDAHHLRFVQSRALGRKVSDEFTVPLCRGHHRELHRCGDEIAWWTRVGLEPIAVARTLWLKSHPLPVSGNSNSVDAVNDAEALAH